MNNYETLQEAGYEHLECTQKGEHILLNLLTGIKEIWFANKHHASYGIIYKNTHLEFARSL